MTANKSLLFDEKKFLEQCNDRRDLSKEEFEEKYQKFPEKVEFEFILWYSSIEKKKVLKAYERWKNENPIKEDKDSFYCECTSGNRGFVALGEGRLGCGICGKPF